MEGSGHEDRVEYADALIRSNQWAKAEEQLDKISAGDLNWKQVLADFWKEFNAAVGETADLRITEVLDALNEVLGPHVFPAAEDGKDPRACPNCDDGRLSLKVGKFGDFSRRTTIFRTFLASFG